MTPDATCSTPLQAQSVALPAPKGMRLPFGAVDFSIGGCAVGVQALVRTEVPEVLATEAQLLKYQRSTGQWSPVPGAKRVGNGFEYWLVDGGELDEDGRRDGSLRDPYAIAEPVPTAPASSATPVPASSWPALALGMLSVLALACRRTRHHH